MGKIILNGKEYVTSTTRGFPPLIYSDEEREVGVWRDGKPLYQKTFNGSFASDQTSLNINWGITGIQVLHIWGFLIPSDTPNNRVIIGNNYDESSLVIFKGVGGTGTTIGRGNVAYFGSTPTAYVTILYTKTTDTAGSGKYSPVSDLSHHYSKTEQVVGTWIDGNTIYETSYELTSAKTLSGSWSHSNIVIDNISKIIRVVSALDADGQTIPLVIGLYSGYELALAYSGGPNNSLKYFTIQYTKSSS